MEISKKTFCDQYLEGTAAAAARAVLPDQTLPLEEWRKLWRQQLNAPVK